MTDNIFEGGEPQAPAPVVAPAVAAPADQLLASIVNPDGTAKYANVEVALNALKASQDHIARLETENTAFQASAAKATTMEEILNAVKPAPVVEPDPVVPASIDEGQIAQLVQGYTAQAKAEEVAKQNVDTVLTRVRAKYGDEAGTKFYEDAAAKGFDREDINALAAKNPKAIFSILGLEEAPVAPKLGGSINSAAFQQKASDRPAVSGMAYGKNALMDNWRYTKAKVNKELGIE